MLALPAAPSEPRAVELALALAVPLRVAPPTAPNLATASSSPPGALASHVLGFQKTNAVSTDSHTLAKPYIWLAALHVVCQPCHTG